MVVVTGVPKLAPVAPDNVTLKVFVPMKGAALLIATVKLLDAESFAAQLSVPLVAVNSVPAAAVPAAVA